MRTNDISVSFMKRGSAVVVGTNDEDEAVTLYKQLLGTTAWYECSKQFYYALIKQIISLDDMFTRNYEIYNLRR